MSDKIVIGEAAVDLDDGELFVNAKLDRDIHFWVEIDFQAYLKDETVNLIKGKLVFIPDGEDSNGLKTKLQNSLVAAERSLALVKENSEHNELIMAAEEYALDCWLRLLALPLKEKYGIHVDDLLDALQKVSQTKDVGHGQKF